MITLIDHGTTNLLTLQGALDRLGAQACRASRPGDVAPHGPILLLATGCFEEVQGSLKANGWWQEIPQLVAEGRPFLGMDMGLHILAEGSEESPLGSGLGLLPGLLRRLGPGVKVPHVGWAQVHQTRAHPALPDPRGAWLHFAHSYALEPTDETLCVAVHGRAVSVAEVRGHVVGIQARLEKSGAIGLVLLQHILAWMGEAPAQDSKGSYQ